MSTHRPLRLLALSGLAALVSCQSADAPATAESAAEDAAPSPYLYVWAGDADAAESDSDFLAVVDADPSSPTYGTLLSTAPVGSVGNGPHHAEPVAPGDGLLFANGWDSHRTFLFDLSSPAEPAFVRELDPVPGYDQLHSLYRLENGHVLATMQKGDGSSPDDTGGLVEFGPEGELVRVTSAVDPAWEGRMIRPYAVWVFEDVDRVLTTSFSMSLEKSENALQVWRISDLSLVATLPLPEAPAAAEPECYLEQMVAEEEGCAPDRIPGHDRPFEIRRMPDGSAMLNTIACGFYRIAGLESDHPDVQLVLNWTDKVGCAVPTMVGPFQVMPNMFMNEIVTLDMSDPAHPVEVARMELDQPFMPHWAQSDEGSNRVAFTGIGPEAGAVLMYRVDPETGQLTPDEAFGQGGGSPALLAMNRDEWPHGATGAAIPHAALFGR